MDSLKHFKKFYGWIIFTLSIGIVLLVVFKFGQNSVNHLSSPTVLKNIFTQYLFKNTYIDFGIYLIILSPLIYWVLKTAISRTLPTENKAIAQLAKTKNVISILLGLTSGITLWITILIASRHFSDAGPMFLTASILGVLVISVIIFAIEYAPSITDTGVIKTTESSDIAEQTTEDTPQ